MKYNKKNARKVLLSAMVVVSGGLFFQAVEAKALDVDANPTLIYKNLPKTVTVGQSGKFEFSCDPIEGIPIIPEVSFDLAPVEERCVINIDNEGNWKALGVGSVKVQPNAEISQDSIDQLEAKYPNVAIYSAEAIGLYSKNDFYIEIKDRPGENTRREFSYRVYNPNTGEHFYTKNDEERFNLEMNGWDYEFEAWYTLVEGDTPVYRVYNPNAGDHHYTSNAAEVAWLVKNGWKDEGTSFKASAKSETPVYRLYNENAKSGAHHYTLNVDEKNNLVNAGWKDEGIAWYE